jgi:hypothetical protein
MVFLHSEDLEQAMREKYGSKATLDDEKAAVRFTRALLKENFELVSEGKPMEFVWVGMEVRTHFAVVYLEFRAPSADVTVRHAVFLDRLADQSNTVRVKRDGKDERDLTFDRQKPGPQSVFALRSRDR